MSKGKIVLYVILALLIGCSSKEHLLFNKVPIDGQLNKFAGTLTKLGFILADSTKSNEIILQGELFNKVCKIHVLGTNVSNLAYKVIVSLPEEEHDSLQADFEKLQKQFSLKYGMGYSKYQQYKKRERLVYKVPARNVMTGDYTRYTTDSGEIAVEVMEGFISITYTDKLNNEVWNK